MKATIDFDPALYRRLKVEAARRGRTVRDLVAEGVRAVLDSPAANSSGDRAQPADWSPAWLGALAAYSEGVADHSMDAVRASVASARASENRQ